MKHLISIFLILTGFNNAFSQTIDNDTLIAREYLFKADRFNEKSQFDSSLINLKKAENIYLKYNLNNAFLECELKRSDIFINKNDLNKALEILLTGKQKVLSSVGKNTALYTDYCNKTGLVYLYAEKYAEAKKMWIKALVIRRNLYGNKHPKVAVSYNNLGVLYDKTGDYYKSLKLHQNALKIREELLPAEDLRIASSLMNVGRAYSKIGNPDLALNCFLKSFKIKKKTSSRFSPDLADLYINLAAVYYSLEEYDKSLMNYKKVLLIRQHNFGEDYPETAGIYAKMAVVLNTNGNYDKALEYNEKALNVFEEKYGEEHSAVAKIVQNIASVYLNKDDFKKAVEYFNRSLEISKKIYGIWDLRTAEQYTKVGEILNQKSEHTAALNYFFNALKIQRNVFKTDNHLEIAETFLHIGNAYKDDEEYYSALEYYNKSMPIRINISGNKHTETAHIYYVTASVYKAKRGYAAELKNLQKALIADIENFNAQDINVNPDFNDETSFYFNQKNVLETLKAKAEAFSNIFLRTDNTDNLKQACNVYECSDILLDRIKTSVSGKKDEMYLEEYMSSIYKKAAGVCMQLFKKTNESKYLNKAFMYAEKNKTGILLSLPKAENFAEIPGFVLQKETNLKADIAYFGKKVSENPNDTETKDKMLSILKKHKSFMKMLKRNFQKYYKLKYEPFSVTISDIQNSINDSTLVLDYFSAEPSKYIYIFLIRKDKTDIRFIKKTDDFNTKILSFRKHLYSNTENSMRAYTEEGYALYKDLIPTVSESDTSIKQLILIPDGTLGIIPFESLLTELYEGNWDTFEDYPYLIKKYAVSYSYSARLFQKNYFKKDTLNDIDTIYMSDWAGIAPVFDDMNYNKISIKTRDVLKKAEESFPPYTQTSLLSGDNISRLPGNENEVRAIFNVFENREKYALLKVGAEADESFIKSCEPENYKFIHFAAPGFVNSEEPELSGILTARGTGGENDGVLYTEEFFNLKLNSDLIVLSACETGLNKFGRGEGIIAFTGALFYGGTKNIICSLWQVTGESTENLMVHFYDAVLTEYDNTDAFNYSLRLAKLKLIEEGTYAHPFFWSPFILIKN